MAKVRGAREGSIYQRKSDGRWVAACTVNGKQQYQYARTKEEARQKLREMQRRREDGQPVTLPRQTLGQFLDRWLEDAIKPSVRSRTYASYAQMVRLHLKPPWAITGWTSSPRSRFRHSSEQRARRRAKRATANSPPGRSITSETSSARRSTRPSSGTSSPVTLPS